ncbi:MAG: NAD(P)/FAD-dependent oxidoreductase [Anaerolineales bacterium]|nr:NAD(P)/FAD-dependent oxidoreductase [Anaerolineales bacterium]
MQKTSVIIIGAGPAGLTTALQLKRVGIPALLFEGMRIGGLLHNANLVENYPGFPRGVTGPRLVNLFQKQAAHLNVEIVAGQVAALDFCGSSFIAKTGDGEYCAPIAVVASGTKPRLFAEGLIPPETRSRVVYEVCEIADVFGQQVVIVGAGDAAFDYALNMARHHRVTILNRGSRVRALGLLQERVRQNGHIVYRAETQVAQVGMADKDTLLLQLDGPAGVEITEANFLVGALGRVPQVDFLTKNIRAREDELLARGVLYFVGDVCNGIFRQTAIAAGDALRAAMKIEQFLRRVNEGHCENRHG